MAKFVHLQESGFGKTFSTPITMPAFIRRIRDGRGRVFSCMAGQWSKFSGRGGGGARQGPKSSGRGGAGQRSKSPRGAGQNLSISADLDNFRFEQNSIIWFACESIQERSLSVVSNVTIPPLNLKIWRLTSSFTLEKSPLLVNSATILAVTTVVWSITCFHTPERNLLLASNATTPASSLIFWRCTWKSTVQKEMHEQT